MAFNNSTMPSVHDPSHPVHRVRKEMKDFNDYYDEYFGPDRCKRKESNKEKLATLRAKLNQADAAYDEQGEDLKKAEDENARFKKQLREAKKSLDIKQKELETQK
jgi:predicted ribosome quality control (RQC) complex YloA/Tae2 family protein